LSNVKHSNLNFIENVQIDHHYAQCNISTNFSAQIGGEKNSKSECCKIEQIWPWPTKSELRCAYYGRNKARIFNGAIDSANLKKFTLNQLHLLAKWKRKM
jgi:hypothetical protein